MKEDVKIWVSSDWHLGHKNILRFDQRNFKSIEEHDWYIINRFNSLVSPEDIVYYLGDFSFAGSGLTKHYISSLKGNLKFIKGNHDKSNTIKLYEKFGEYLGEKHTTKINGNVVVFDHFSNRVWNASHHGSFHIYGHSHDSLDNHGNYWGRSMDGGIMSALRLKGDYVPFNLIDDIFPILIKREAKIIDHHEKATK